jgi:hypothetical protein
VTAQSTARQAHDSGAMQGLARLGLAARGTVWLVIGLLALQVLRGGSAQADQNGALRAVADKPFGEALLVVLVVGFLGYAAYRLLSAAVGHRDQDGAARTGHRAVSAAKALLYLGLAGFTARFLVQGGGQDKTRSVTADVMSHTGGRSLVGAAGLVLVGIGTAMAVKGLKKDHAEDLEQGRIPARLRRPAVVLGTVGLLGRGAVLALVGAFLVRAAVQFDPKQAKGLDAALQALVQQPYGKVLLGAAVLGVLAYGLWSYVEATYRDL